ncbi:MAG: hypothetical protein KDD69_11620 [Bdellovibrionales bacterium]|nr:hypothetical protein [Bdellovibrionales bacterium]
MLGGMEDNSTDILAPGLRSLLRPVARFCLRHSFKLQRVTETLKAVMVEVGREELVAQGLPATANRLSAMTGVHRKDVSRLLEDDFRERPAHDVYTKIIGQWRSDPQFSRRGLPRPLELAGGKGQFAALVSSVTKELSCYTVLNELERLKLIERMGDLVVLRSNEYVPKRSVRANFKLVEKDVEDLLSAVESNTLSLKDVPNLHLTTRYDNIAEEHLPQIQEWLIKQGAKAHQAARTYLAKFDCDLNPKLQRQGKTGGGRVAFGTFGLAEASDERSR